MIGYHFERFKAGDVIGFSGRCRESVLINICTGGIPFWGLSHVGILSHAPGGQLLMFESSDDGTAPCEITGRSVVGVQAHSLDDAVKRYKGRIWLYSLYRSLYPYESRRLTESMMYAIGRPYDNQGAVRSGGFLFSAIESLFWGQDFSQYFCSELTASELSRIGIFPTTNASRWNPNHLIRTLRRDGIIHKPRRLK